VPKTPLVTSDPAASAYSACLRVSSSLTPSSRLPRSLQQLRALRTRRPLGHVRYGQDPDLIRPRGPVPKPLTTLSVRVPPRRCLIHVRSLSRVLWVGGALQRLGTISRPSGVSETGIILKFASPRGMPMMSRTGPHPRRRGRSPATDRPERTTRGCQQLTRHRGLRAARSLGRTATTRSSRFETPRSRMGADDRQVRQGTQDAVGNGHPDAREHEPDDIE